MDEELLDEVLSRLPDVARDPLPLGNKTDPYDELIYILLTNQTRSQPRIDRAFDGLKDLAGPNGWSGLLDVDPDDVRDVLKPLGVQKRAERILDLVALIAEEHDSSLTWLEDVDDATAMAFLTSLPGVGPKTAKCVLMYALGREVLPVDIHVLRVAKRLGLVAEDVPWAEADRAMERAVPSGAKFDVHVAFVIHGRQVCKSRNPQCEGCVLLDLCPTGDLAPRLKRDYTG